MGSKTSTELCEEAIEGWKRAMNLSTEIVAPTMAASGFLMGKLKKKDRKEFKKKHPEEYKNLMDNINKGIKLAFAKSCSKCKLDNDSDASFCKGCGTRLGE